MAKATLARMSAQTGSPGPVILALDTATETLCAALHDGRAGGPGRVWAHEEPGGAAASQRLIPVLHALLAQAGLALHELDAIAFVQGPGAFTGLRTACAVAQGLGWALAKPLLPLDALMLVAEGSPEPRREGQRCLVAVDARMGEVYAGVYRWQQGPGQAAGQAGWQAGWQAEQPPALWAPADWPQQLGALSHGASSTACLGNGWQVHAAELADAARRLQSEGPQAIAAPAPAAAPRAQALARLALAAWRGGLGVPAAQALPLYLRDKVAQTTDERAAARAAAQAAPSGPAAPAAPAVAAVAAVPAVPALPHGDVA